MPRVVRARVRPDDVHRWRSSPTTRAAAKPLTTSARFRRFPSNAGCARECAWVAPRGQGPDAVFQIRHLGFDVAVAAAVAGALGAPVAVAVRLGRQRERKDEARETTMRGRLEEHSLLWLRLCVCVRDCLCVSACVRAWVPWATHMAG